MLNSVTVAYLHGTLRVTQYKHLADIPFLGHAVYIEVCYLHTRKVENIIVVVITCVYTLLGLVVVLGCKT